MDTFYVYGAALWCDDCGARIIRRLIRANEHPDIDCRQCVFKGRIGRDAARKAFDNRNGGEWLQCPKCLTCAATFVDQDSDQFPSSQTNLNTHASDCVEHCAAHDKCLNAVDTGETLENGKPYRIGAWLENDLTCEGRDELQRDLITCKLEGRFDAVHALWAQWYSDVLELDVFLWRVTFISYAGSKIFSHDNVRSFEPDEDKAEARKQCIEVLRQRVHTGHTVTRIRRKPDGMEWEVGAPDDYALVPDSAGFLIMERVMIGGKRS